MSKEIKFRAWDNVDMKMYYTGVEDNIHFYFDSTGIVAERFYNEEICTPEGARDFYGNFEKLEHLKYLEYTGLKDKNGVEIYEGDIVQFTDFDTSGGNREDREHKGIVKYQSGIYEIWKNNDSEYYGSDGAFILNHAWLQDDEFEVIGNLYEHPHLLEANQ